MRTSYVTLFSWQSVRNRAYDFCTLLEYCPLWLLWRFLRLLSLLSQKALNSFNFPMFSFETILVSVNVSPLGVLIPDHLLNPGTLGLLGTNYGIPGLIQRFIFIQFSFLNKEIHIMKSTTECRFFTDKYMTIASSVVIVSTAATGIRTLQAAIATFFCRRIYFSPLPHIFISSTLSHPIPKSKVIYKSKAQLWKDHRHPYL